MNLPLTHINCLGIHFPVARTFVTQKNCFRIIREIMSGLIVVRQGHCYTHLAMGGSNLAWATKGTFLKMLTANSNTN